MANPRDPTRSTARALETAWLLGTAVVVLLVTGAFMSATIRDKLGFEGSIGAGLYVIHLAAAAVLVVGTVWHLVPFNGLLARSKKVAWPRLAASTVLLLLVIVQLVTGYALWRHDYRLVPKALAAQTHLAVWIVFAIPFFAHASRGIATARARAHAKAVAKQAVANHPAKDAWTLKQAAMSRRAFIRLGVLAAAGVAVAYAFGRSVKQMIGDWPLNSVGQTPALTKENYALRVTGLVERPLSLSYADLVGMGLVTREFTHHCVEGWTYTNSFTGVPLAKILERAGGAKAGAEQVILHSPERSTHPLTRGQAYTTNFPVADALRDDMLITLKVAGEDLPAEHGGPVRLMTPSKWGYKACKWLTEIELSADPDYRGYWERAGYNNNGDRPGSIYA